MVDYKALYEVQRLENEDKQRRIVELESQQRVMETSFRTMFRLHREFEAIQVEAERTNDSIPSRPFAGIGFDDDAKRMRFESASPTFSSELQESLTDTHMTSPSPPTISFDDSGFVDGAASKPLLPKLSYAWDEMSTGMGGGNGRYKSPYMFLTRSNFRGTNKVDELKMTFTFDLPKSAQGGAASSMLLPDKVQLEIRDGGGRIVFKKRQNVYYVKLQERISALDSKKDYFMELKSIEGGDEAVENVVIYHKGYVPEVQRELTLSPSDPAELRLQDALEEFIEEVKVWEEAMPMQDQLDVSQKSTPTVESSASPPRTRKSNGGRPGLILKRCAQDVSPSGPAAISSGVGTPVTLRRRLAVPEVKYRWSRGFRKSTNADGSAGRYSKVTLARVEIEFDKDFERLPEEMLFSICCDSQVQNIKQVKVGRLSRKKAHCEFQIPEDRSYCVTVSNTSRNAAAYDHLVPQFHVPISPLTDAKEMNLWRKPKLKLTVSL